MTRDLDPFPGWAKRRLRLGGVEIFLRTAGAGPALRLLRGYPQTPVCNLAGAEIDPGPLLAEENPEATVAAGLPFLAAHGGR